MADSQSALVTYHRVSRKMVGAFLALRSTAGVCPVFMDTVVALDQTGSLLANLFRTSGGTRCWAPGHNLLRTSLESLVVPLSAGTVLPVDTTEVAEIVAALASASDCQLVFTQTLHLMQVLRDVVATKGEVDHSSALVASTPAFFRGKLQRLLHGFILGTISTVPSCLALGASSLSACWAGGDVVGDEGRSDELRASRVRAVDALVCESIKLFLLLCVFGGEFGVDLGADCFPGHLTTAASWREQALICHRKAMELFYASDAVVVAARRMERLVR